MGSAAGGGVPLLVGDGGETPRLGGLVPRSMGTFAPLSFSCGGGDRGPVIRLSDSFLFPLARTARCAPFLGRKVIAPPSFSPCWRVLGVLFWFRPTCRPVVRPRGGFCHGSALVASLSGPVVVPVSGDHRFPVFFCLAGGGLQS